MSKRKVAIVGSGVGGLTLAYALARDGRVDVAMFTNKDADDHRNGRIPSTQVHFERFFQTEERYGIPNYGPVYEVNQIELLVGGQKLFKGNVAGKAGSMDQRLYLSALFEGLHQNGVSTYKRRISDKDFLKLAEQYDAIIDCTGKAGPRAPFPVYEGISNSPAAPLRVCSAGLFRGLEPDEDNKMGYHIVPGLGELFETSTMTANGVVRQLLLEAVPGSELDRIKGDRGPEAFAHDMRAVLEVYFPHIFERVNRSEFRLADPKAYMRVAIKPEVCIPYTTINETLVAGCGDSVVLNDPITGQGGNTASYCADLLCNVLTETMSDPWDASTGELYWSRIKEYVTKMSEWSNAMMGPPSESFADLMAQASQCQRTADELVNLFKNPIKAHEAFFAPPRKEATLR